MAWLVAIVHYCFVCLNYVTLVTELLKELYVPHNLKMETDVVSVEFEVFGVVQG